MTILFLCCKNFSLKYTQTKKRKKRRKLTKKSLIFFPMEVIGFGGLTEEFSKIPTYILKMCWSLQQMYL